MEKNEVITLEDRGFIQVKGTEAKDFLQNIVTNDIEKVTKESTIFSSILTPQGKYLFEFFILKLKDSYLIECEKESTEELLGQDISLSEDIQEKSSNRGKPLSTRHNLQIMRRLFHMFNGFAIATLYLISFDHSQMVHFLGTLACILYVVEQVRINYPETAAKLLPFTRFIIRAEEQLKESAMVPYAMAVLLTLFFDNECISNAETETNLAFLLKNSYKLLRIVR